MSQHLIGSYILGRLDKLFVALIAAASLHVSPAHATPRSSDGRPNANSICYAPMRENDRFVAAREVDGDPPAWAFATYVRGYPTIIYSSFYYTMPRYMREFTRAHECCHLSVPTTDEYEANCCAIESLRLTRDEIYKVASYTARNAPSAGAQYGGSGAEFWRRTVAICGR